MPTPPSPPPIFGWMQWATQNLWAPVAGVIGLLGTTIWKQTFGRIRNIERFIEERAVTKEEFKAHVALQETQRREVREDMHRIETGVDRVSDRLDKLSDRQEQIRTDLLGAIDRLNEQRLTPGE